MTENELLKELAKFKLRNIQKCPLCSNEKLIVQYEPEVQIKCTACNFYENLFTNTAFEGINIPVMRIYNVVAFIQERVIENADFDFKRINLNGELFSVNEVLDLFRKDQVSEETTGKLILETLDRDRVTSFEISHHFNINEDEVENLFTKMVMHTGNFIPGSKPNSCLNNIFEKATIDSILESLVSPPYSEN